MKAARHNLPAEKKQALIQKIVACLESEQSKMSAVYLFGSFILGKDFADIDLALLLRSRNVESLKLELATESMLEVQLGVPVDVSVMNTAPLSFQYQVFRDGQLIFDKDPNYRAKYEGQVLKQYFDFARYRKRYLKEAFHAPL